VVHEDLEVFLASAQILRIEGLTQLIPKEKSNLDESFAEKNVPQANTNDIIVPMKELVNEDRHCY